MKTKRWRRILKTDNILGEWCNGSMAGLHSVPVGAKLRSAGPHAPPSRIWLGRFAIRRPLDAAHPLDNKLSVVRHRGLGLRSASVGANLRSTGPHAPPDNKLSGFLISYVYSTKKDIFRYPFC